MDPTEASEPEDPADPDALLARGDTLRDARRWVEAAEVYRAYLLQRPWHWQILVQLGHCARQLGDLPAALAHYRRAELLAPDAWDPPFQAGHVLRLLGRGFEAAEAFQRAQALNPGSTTVRRDAWISRHRLPEAQAVLPVPRLGQPQLAFDVTDLVDYLRAARTPTGIQRVQLGILGAILAEPERRAEIVLTAYDAGTWRWWQVEETAFRRVVTLASTGAREDDPAWRAAVSALAVPDLRPDAPLRPGCTLTNLGNAWGIEDYFRGLRMLRERLKLRYVAFLHDCVPLVMPEHCLDLTVRLYARWFAALPHHADALLANSEATAEDVARFSAPIAAAPLRPIVTRLGAETPEELPGAAAAAADQLREPRPGEPFILFVATLESRKNHLMVFSAWLALIRRLGAARVPRLVCVGRPGWRAEPAMALLAQSPELRRKVTVLTGVSDLALSGLYARCLFTVYNSFHEGWGLPVSESLARGKLAVVPEHTGLRESGAPGAVFFRPQDEPHLVETLERLLSDPGHRRTLEARIDRARAVRSWEVVAREVLTALLRPPAGAALPPPPPLPAGHRLDLGWRGEFVPSRDMGLAERVREGLGWWPQEQWGVWTRDGTAVLALPVQAEPGQRLRIYLELRCPPAPLRVLLRAGQAARRRIDLEAGQDVTCILEAEAGEGPLRVEIDSGDGALHLAANATSPTQQRIVGVGLRGVMVCAEDDLAARLSALERAEAEAEA